MNKFFMMMIIGLGLMASNSLEAQTSYNVSISGPFPCFSFPIVTTGPGGQAQFITNVSGNTTQSLTGIPTGGGSHGAGLFYSPCGGPTNHVWDPAADIEEWILTFDYCCNGTEYTVTIAIQHDYGAGTKSIIISSVAIHPCEYANGCTIK